jgi:hypothetical protein
MIRNQIMLFILFDKNATRSPKEPHNPSSDSLSSYTSPMIRAVTPNSSGPKPSLNSAVILSQRGPKRFLRGVPGERFVLFGGELG